MEKPEAVERGMRIAARSSRGTALACKRGLPKAIGFQSISRLSAPHGGRRPSAFSPYIRWQHSGIAAWPGGRLNAIRAWGGAFLKANMMMFASHLGRPPQIPSAAFCILTISAMPPCARSSKRFMPARSNATPSAVPCTSMKWPASVITTFMSVSQPESSM